MHALNNKCYAFPPAERWSRLAAVCVGKERTREEQVFRVKKLVGRRWGAPNSNYLLVMVSTFVMPFTMDPLSPRMTPGCIMQK